MKVTKAESGLDTASVCVDQAVCILEHVYGHPTSDCTLDRCGVCVLLRLVRRNGYRVVQERHESKD